MSLRAPQADLTKSTHRSGVVQVWYNEYLGTVVHSTYLRAQHNRARQNLEGPGHRPGLLDPLGSNFAELIVA